MHEWEGGSGWVWQHVCGGVIILINLNVVVIALIKDTDENLKK